MEEAIEVVRAAFIAASTGMVKMPVRTAIEVDDGNTALFMPVARSDTKGIGIKVVTVFPHNGAQNLPTIHALVLYSDPTTGAPAAILEGSYVTALRTGAAGGLAADLLANANASSVTLIGAGVQGWFQLLALSAVRRLEHIFVVDIDSSAAESLSYRLHDELGLSGSVPANLDAAIESSDIVVTATTSREPVFNGNALRPGTHITAIGAFTPSMRELDDVALSRCDRIVVDSREAAWAEAGDLIIPHRAGWFEQDRVVAEIGEVAARLQVGRQSSQQITLFKTVGIAVLDLAIAETAVARARDARVGEEVDLY